MKNGIWTKTKQTEQFSVCMEELSLSNSHCSTTAWLLYDDDDDGTASWHLIEIIVCNHLKRLAGDMQATRSRQQYFNWILPDACDSIEQEWNNKETNRDTAVALSKCLTKGWDVALLAGNRKWLLTHLIWLNLYDSFCMSCCIKNPRNSKHYFMWTIQGCIWTGYSWCSSI